jgi:hypothetical protein
MHTGPILEPSSKFPFDHAQKNLSGHKGKFRLQGLFTLARKYEQMQNFNPRKGRIRPIHWQLPFTAVYFRQFFYIYFDFDKKLVV